MNQSQALGEVSLTLYSANPRALLWLETQISSFISIGSSQEVVRHGVMYPEVNGLVQIFYCPSTLAAM